MHKTVTIHPGNTIIQSEASKPTHCSGAALADKQNHISVNDSRPIGTKSLANSQCPKGELYNRSPPHLRMEQPTLSPSQTLGQSVQTNAQRQNAFRTNGGVQLPPASVRPVGISNTIDHSPKAANTRSFINHSPKTPNPSITAIQPLSETPHNPMPLVGFITGKAAASPTGDIIQRFDPCRPTTIRRTQGIDHSKSSPVPRKQIQATAEARASLSAMESAGINRILGFGPHNRRAFHAPGPNRSTAFAGIKRPLDGISTSDPR